MAATRLHPRGGIASASSARPVLRLVNASEFIAAIAALSGARDSGANGGAIAAARLVNGVEYAVSQAGDERKMRSAWSARKGGGQTPLVVVADDPDAEGMLRVLGPIGTGPVRRIRAESLRDLVGRTTAMKR